MQNITEYRLFESAEPKLDADAILKDLAEMYTRLQASYYIKYPDPADKDGVDGAAEHEFNIRFGGWDSSKSTSTSSGEVLGFIIDAIRKDRYVVNKFSAREKDRAKFFRGCYYNALDYSLRFGAKLCHGFMVPASTFANISTMAKHPVRKDFREPIIEITQHAFNMKGGRIIDPTMGNIRDEYYIYEEVPESMWHKFAHLPDDKNFDAREFKGYINDRVAIHKLPFDKLVGKNLNENASYKAGECYKNVQDYLLDHNLPDATIIHGEITNSEKTMLHAWIVDGDDVIDPTTGATTNKSKYYRQLNAKEISKYSFSDAMKLRFKTKNYGPWTDAERN